MKNLASEGRVLPTPNTWAILLTSLPLAPGSLYSRQHSGAKSCCPGGKRAEVTVCSPFLSLSHCLGLKRGKPALLAAATLLDSAGSGDPHCPSGSSNAWGPAVAEDSRQTVESGALSTLLPVLHGACLWGICEVCGVFFQSLLLVSGQPPTSHPPRGLTSATFTSTRGSWLAHTESWLASWRTHAPSHGSHGISPVRCLWQLQFPPLATPRPQEVHSW